jgi:S-adenosylmethionine decarboxylase
VVDAFGCDASRLADRARVVALLDQIVATLELRVVGEPAVHGFPAPGGVTALYLLAESHLTCHTFPESGVASLNLYCCRPRPTPDLAALVTDALGAARVTTRTLARGGAG